MDDRLKQVQTTDLTDSRVNHDFVDWLKTKGMNWLLVFLLAACAFLGVDWYRNKQSAARDQAWSELEAATSPAAYRGVADDHQTTDAVAEMAMIQAADMLLNSVNTGLKPGFTAADEGAQLSPEERVSQLAEAEQMYVRAGSLAEARPGFAGKPVQLSALFGRAAVAEAAGRLEDARTHLEAAAALAEPEYGPIALQAKARLENLEEVMAFSTLLAAATIAEAELDGIEFNRDSKDDLIQTFEAEARAEAAEAEAADAAEVETTETTEADPAEDPAADVPAAPPAP